MASLGHFFDPLTSDPLLFYALTVHDGDKLDDSLEGGL